MPSRFSSPDSEGDAEKLARNFGIDFRTIPIEPAHATLLDMLATDFAGRPPDLAEENLQSRIRGVLVMALSNKLGWTVLTCGNKSESAVGYSTLYGDTAGGFAVIRDVPKLLVFALARRRNERAAFDAIPAAVLDKAPSAELRPDQRDDQSLPPYEILDPILERYVEHDASASSIIAEGFDEKIVRRVISLVDRSEYKRRQTPLGPRITGKAFGRDRRVPITNRFSE
jgi:NAD+ synthase (glutamine-hydrolysing)